MRSPSDDTNFFLESIFQIGLDSNLRGNQITLKLKGFIDYLDYLFNKYFSPIVSYFFVCKFLELNILHKSVTNICPISLFVA
jgi:hypothetical protein